MEVRRAFPGTARRCAVAHLYFEEKWSSEQLKLKTKSGIKRYDFLSRNGNEFWYRAELGKPKFKADEIPFDIATNSQRIAKYELPISSGTIPVSSPKRRQPGVCRVCR